MKKPDGFTLMEMLVCMSLLMILYGLSSAYISPVSEQNKLQIITNNLKEALLYAKTQALAQNKTLMIEPLSIDKDWSYGIKLCESSKKGKALRVWDWNPATLRVTWQGFQSKYQLIFSPELAQSAVNGFFVIKGEHKSIKLIVNRLGRSKVSSIR